MIPMRHSTIFKNRWMALVWAAGIIWFAYDFAAPDGDADSNNADVTTQLTDATGAPITPDDEQKFASALNGL
jgi:hypothetical protein